MFNLIKLREDLVQFATQAAAAHTQYIQHHTDSNAHDQLENIQYLQVRLVLNLALCICLLTF
jgi:hypothetical protein